MASKKKKTINTLIVDFKGQPQVVQDIARVAPTLPGVVSVKLTDESSGELNLVEGYTYEQLSQALHQHWPERY